MSSGGYSEAVRALFAELPGAGDLPPGAGTVITGEARALDRQAWVRLEARVHEGRIAACGFRAFGCPHLLAATALLARRRSGLPLQGATVQDIHALAAELEVPAGKLGRLLVLQDAEAALLQQAALLR